MTKHLKDSIIACLCVEIILINSLFGWKERGKGLSWFVLLAIEENNPYLLFESSIRTVPNFSEFFLPVYLGVSTMVLTFGN